MPVGVKTINKLFVLGFSVFFGLSMAACQNNQGSNSTPSESTGSEISNSEHSSSEHQHALTHVEAVAATCTEAGNIEYWVCEDCTSYFADANATDSITVENTVVAATGHTEVVDAAVEPTCTEKGKTEGKHCSVCNEVTVAQEEVAAKGHTEVVDAAVEATCTEKGKTEGKHCSVCNTVTVAQEEVAAKGHSHQAVVTAPTHTEAGYTTYTCSCGDTYTSDEVAALGHSHQAVVTAPTHTEAGYTTYTCSCGDTYTEAGAAALGHKFIDGVCSCGAEFVVQAGGWTLATEIKDGDRVLIGAPAYGKLLSAEKVSAGSYYNKGVNYSINDFSNVTDAEIFVVTANADGSYTFTSVTGKVIALAASYSSLNDTGIHKSWTLTEKSEGIFYLKNTGRGSYLEWYASKNNWSTYTTSSLSDLFEISFYVEAEAGEHEHNYISEVHAPTCTEAGYTSFTCRCGDAYTEAGAAALGHSHKAVVTAPTCTEAGYTTYTCTCGDTYTEAGAAALGHTEVVDAAVAPTCTTAGKTEGKHCSVCNTVTVPQEVVPAAHGNVTHHEAVAPTCDEAGTVEYYHCDVCNKNYADADLTVEVTDIVDPARGHNVSATKTVGAPDLANGTALLANFCTNPNCSYHENAETIQGPTEYAASITNEDELASFFEVSREGYTYTFVFEGNKLTNTNAVVKNSSAYLTLHAKTSGTFTFDTVTCTEVGYDYLTISVNGSEKFNSKNAGGNSSSVVTKSHAYEVEAGQTVVFYKKADSSSFGKDSNGREDYADIINMKFVSASAPADAQMILVSFDTDSDVVVAPVALFANSSLSSLPETSKEGHFFKGWFADEALTQEFDVNTILAENTTIYAGYVSEADAHPLYGHYKGYNVYGLNFANRESEVEVDAIGRISGSFTGSIVNYDAETGMVTWENEAGSQGYFVYDSVTGTFALKSLTSPQAAINLSTDFYLFTRCQATATPSAIAFYDANNSLSIKLVEFVVDEETTRRVLIKDNAIYPNVTYTSIFTENPTVANMKEISDVVVRDAENNIIVAVGYDATVRKLVNLDSIYGIYTNAENTIKLNGLGAIAVNDATGTYVVENGIVKATVDGVFYHITLDQENGTYTSTIPMATVTFDSVEGTSCEAVEVNLTMPVGELPTTTREGHVFMGWYDNAEFTGNPVTAEYIVNGEVTLYAKWLAKVTLTIDTNEGTAIDPIDTAASLPIESPVEPTREGYRFDGYFCEETFENTFSFADGITTNTTIYVKWVKVWSVTMNSNNGQEATVVVVDDQSNYEIPAFVNPGSVFKGWYTTETFEAGSEYVTGSAVTADVVVYAKWEIGKYANDAANYIDAADTDAFVSNVEFEATNPWATGSYNGQVWMVSTNQGKGSANDAISFTLAKNAVVSFDYIVNSESNYDFVIVSVNGSQVLSTKVSGMNGKDVIGSYTAILNAGDVVSIAYKKDSSGNQGLDTAYVGNFVFETVEEVSVTYVYNDGVTANESISVSKGAAIAELPQPSREGHIFMGWYTDEAFEAKYEGQNIMAVTTLYAKWVDTASLPGLVRETATTILIDEDKTYTNVMIAPNQTTVWVKAVVTETNNYRDPQMYLRPEGIDGNTLKGMIASVEIYKNDETTALKSITSCWSNTSEVWPSNFGSIISTENAVVNETVYYVCITLNSSFAEMTNVGMVIYY